MRAILISATLAVAAIGAPLTAEAIARHYNLNIPRQPLDSALKDFAQQTGLQVARLVAEEAADVTVGPVAGDLSAADALEALLAPRGLTYQLVNERTIAVVDASRRQIEAAPSDPGNTSGAQPAGVAPSAQDAKGDQKRSFWERFRVAQVEQMKTASDGRAESNASGGSVTEGVRGELEEIVVTALKRETKIQDTPLAITAVSGDTLSAMGVSDITSLNRVSPGLIVTPGNVSRSRLTIRNIRAAGEATVGLYYDDTPVVGSAGVNADAGGTTPGLRLFDIDRVEVLRGPQGTLYGSSSMAGTVRLIFAKPRLEKTEATVSVEGNDVSHGGVGYQSQGMINLPIISDKLAVRAVGFYQDAAGYVDNLAINQNDVNEQTTRGGRLMIRAEPVNGLTIDALAVVQNVSGALNDYYLADGAYNEHYEALQPVRDDFRLFSGTLNWDLGPVRLTAIGSHTRRDFDYSYDFSQFFRTFGALFPVGSPNYNAFNSQAPSVANSPQMTSTDVAEVRLAANDQGPLHWTTGFFYSKREGDFDSNILRVDRVTGAVLPVSATTLLGQRVIGDELKQFAGFAEATYDITDRLSVTGGIRYFDYTRKAANQVTVVNALVGFVAAPPINATSKENGYLYKANVSYILTDDVLAYVTASSGQRPGGVNQVLNLPANLQTYDSDSLWNYELGLKSELLDRKLVLNAAVYQIDWSDMQTAGVLPNTNFGFIANAGSARVRGAEVEATLYPMAGLQLQVSGSYSDARLIQNQTNQTLQAAGLKDDRIPYVPEVTAQASAQYAWDLSPAYQATLRMDANYTGSSWTEFRHTNAFQRYLPSYVTGSVRASLSGPGDWSISAFVHNVADSDAVVNKLSSNIYGGLNNVRAISLAPRTVGIEVTKHF